MKIHHIGYLVKEIDKSIIQFENLGFMYTDIPIVDKIRDLKILFMYNNDVVIELIQSLSNNSRVSGLLKHYINSPYHFCYETNDMNLSIQMLININGYILIETPSPAPAIYGCPNVTFLFNKDIGLIELIEIK